MGAQQKAALSELDSTEGRSYLRGWDVLLRLPAIQRKLDLAAGHNTAGYVSGYPGSPLGGLDTELRRERERLEQYHVRFEPGLNEDLAATAIWGTQYLNAGSVKSDYDGVFGLWYGKGPGVERSADAMRTASYMGTAALGGVVALAGDDHDARSTLTAQQSEPLFMHMGMPILSPATLQEYLSYGILGWGLSRHSKLWVGMICLNDIADSAGTVDLGAIPEIVVPEAPAPPPIKIGKRALETEHDIRGLRIPAARAFARANRLDRVAIHSSAPKVGIVAAGKAYVDVLDALQRLGISRAQAAELGICVYKVGMVWPLEDTGATAFMRGLDEVIVVEAKHPIIEDQLNRIANGFARAERPVIVGKLDERGATLVPDTGALNSALVAEVLARRFARHDITVAARATTGPRVLGLVSGSTLTRKPGFCAGCPHNTSLRMPGGSVAIGGTGCHSMAAMYEVPERETEILPHMGGEGAMWIGMSPFARDSHAFQNVGDGTYSHSGSLAIRAAHAAGVNVTFKVLLNGFISMTGGQSIPGGLSAADISAQVLAEGATKVVVVAEEPRRIRRTQKLPRGVSLRPRRDLIRVQEELGKVKGVTVLIYDQECAAELRRHRKRGTAVDPDKRAYIDPEVCEGCGDCNVQSNCIAVEPLDTELGRKRKIDQSNCNKDFSCVNGYCPSFVTLYGAKPRARVSSGSAALAALPQPPEVDTAISSDEPYSILVGGIGGGGVLTIGAILGVAADLEGKFVSVLNESGIAQKNGAVQSHVRIAPELDAEVSPRMPPGSADLVIGGDMLVVSAPGVLELFNPGRTRVVVNEDIKPTVGFSADPGMDLASGFSESLLRRAAGDRVDVVEANRLATELFGDEIFSNMLLLGSAFQHGHVPLSADAIEQAIARNGVAVEANRQAFRIGRLVVSHRNEVYGLLRGLSSGGVQARKEEPGFDDVVADRERRLVAYQDEAYARRYRQTVDLVRAAESRLGAGREELSIATATYLYKLMAYKDEYEVARLYREPGFRKRIEAEFEGSYRLKVNLAPQILNARESSSGRARKWEIPLGLAMVGFAVLERARKLRGTPLDVFGMTKHRRAERARIAQYEQTLGDLVKVLSPDNYDVAVQIASIPDQIRGFDTIKDQSALAAQEKESELLGSLRSSQPVA
ncbi:indolepyruvate ferredoxin oxidoreductase family protein [Dactylosporangium sp. NPDC000555]|uniref:indolepyruvate ferredoxin oxidoreductase family protein n=1 Tax=Dactylosporangium sp. NPDC000555 TaxID=3154260 RepID=UPI00332ACAFE